MRVKIEYYVYCFDRFLTVIVNEADKEQAERIIDEAYDEWHESDPTMCCEEFILHRLQEQGIAFEVEEEV